MVLALAAANPLLHLQKRWECSSEAPGAFSCYPAETCKSQEAWGTCALSGIEKCGDPSPSETQPVSACQSAAFTACGTSIHPNIT